MNNSTAQPVASRSGKVVFRLVSPDHGPVQPLGSQLVQQTVRARDVHAAIINNVSFVVVLS